MPDALLRALADGAAHSGERLAERFGVTRAAVWKQMAKLEAYGLTVDAVPGRGYRLRRPIDFLDVAGIESALGAACARVGRLELFLELDSTNRHLLGQPAPAPGTMHAALAEFQHAGRGRQGRSWKAPLGGGLCLSVAWQFAETPPGLSALSLAIGVTVRRVLKGLTNLAIGLKWPNDLVFDDRKLGGILVEISAEQHGACRVVAGLGLNVSIPPEQLAALSDWEHGAVDLDTALGGSMPGRSELAGSLMAALAALFEAYPHSGFEPYAGEWRQAHVLADRPVRLVEPAGESFGVVRGIEADGALLLETRGGGLRRVVAGDVSLRRAP